MNDKILSDAKRMFRHACAFADCAHFCEAEHSLIKYSTQWPTVPNIVNSAFSCEVYMKSLLVYHGMEQCEIKKINHGLVELWQEIRIKDFSFTSMIENSIKECFRPSNEAFFDEMLVHISNAFIEWRYIYEGYEVQINRNFLIVLRNYLRDGCCQKYYKKSWSEFVEGEYRWDIT